MKIKINISSIKNTILLSSIFLCFTSFSQNEGALLDWVIQTEGNGNKLGNRIVTIDSDTSNNIIVFGGFSETINLNPLGDDAFFSSWASEETIPYMAKYNEKGRLIWSKTFREQGMDIIGFRKLKTDNEGNIYTFSSLSSGTADFDPGPDSHIETTQGVEYFVASYDPDGNFRWVFKLEQITGFNLKIQDITVNDASQSLSITGYFTNDVNFNPDTNNPVIYDTGGNLDRHIFLANYSLEGDFNWVNTFDNSRSSLNFVHDNYRVTSDETGNVFLSGHFMDSLLLDESIDYITPLDNEYWDAFVTKFDLNGDYLWSFPIKGTNHVTLDNLTYNNSKLYLTGGIYDSVAFNSANQLNTISIKTNEPNSRPFIAIYDSDLGLAEDVFYLTVNNSYGRSKHIEIDNNENIIISGIFVGEEMDFDPSPSNSAIIEHNSNQQETFLAKYTKEGDFKWAFGMPGGIFTKSTGIATIKNDVVIVGEYRGSPDVSAYSEEPVIISTDFSPSINHHSFIAKYREEKDSLPEDTIKTEGLVVFPNPSSESHILQLGGLKDVYVSVELFDIQGRRIRKVYDGHVSESNFHLEVDIANLSSGLYFYAVTTSQKKYSLKFVRE